MAEKYTLPLRAWPSQKSEWEDLPVLVARINAQKGSFRNFTEQTLREEIAGLEAGETETSNGGITLGDETIDPKTRKEELLTARNDTITYVMQAQRESALALDIVSLLVSKHVPRQAELTISPGVKREVPMGSIGAEVVQLSETSGNQRKEDDLVSMGWKLQSLNSTADSLLRSATRLEQEIKQETTHWKQVLEIQEKGWSISRLPNEKHTLGVRFGFAEAAPEFRTRGFAALRRAGDGSVNLDLRTNVQATRSIRVRIQKQDQLMASSLGDSTTDVRHDSIESSILRARNAIFDEELYHELSREARNMANRGVRSTSDAIVIPQEDECRIIIDLVDPESIISKEGENTPLDSSCQHLCQTLALAARILLSYTHRQNHNRRTQLPPPLTDRKMPRPIYSILRPLLALLQQHSAIRRLDSFIDDLRFILANANLAITLESPEALLDISSVLYPVSTKLPLVEALAKVVSAPLQSQFTIKVPAASSELRIHLRTHIQGSEYKVEYIASASSSLSEMQAETILYSLEEVEDHILHLVMLSIISMISSDDPKWKVVSAHEGQLSTEEELDDLHKVLSLSLDREGLRLSCIGAKSTGTPSEISHYWTREIVSRMGLLDTIKSLDSLY